MDAISQASFTRARSVESPVREIEIGSNHILLICGELFEHNARNEGHAVPNSLRDVSDHGR